MLDVISLDSLCKTWRIYVVERDHAIEYAGLDFQNARKHVRGNGKVNVFAAGKWLGIVDYDGHWTFKTKHWQIALDSEIEKK